MSTREIIYAAAGGSAAPTYIEDVFSTWLYTGNGSSQTITNNIDLSGKGGLVWIKDRLSSDYDHTLYDTVRGLASLNSNATRAQQTYPSGYEVDPFNSNGFTVNSAYNQAVNRPTNYVSWTFRKQPKFFDVVTYTGNGSVQNISHSLGSVPAFIITKNLAAGSWWCYHKDLGNATTIRLNSTAASNADANIWNSTTPTSTQFTVGASASSNNNGATYVAYLFAHNAGGFGLTGTDNVISCGSLPDTAGTVVNLGYEPQYILWKKSGSTSFWYIFDVMRGMSYSVSNALCPNSSIAEVTYSGAFNNPIEVNPTGFTWTLSGWDGTSGATAIYMAIRRPMKVPTDATTVFMPVAQLGNSTVTTNFPVDFLFSSNRTGLNRNYITDRLRGSTSNTYNYLQTSSTSTEVQGSGYGYGFDNNTAVIDNGFLSSSDASIYYNFSRRPGFFDEVCFNGQDTDFTVNHNLQAVPELIILKKRNSSGAWFVGGTIVGFNASNNNNNLFLNNTNAISTSTLYTATWTSSAMYMSGGANFAAGSTAVAYLFATCAGVSKVGSYTGTGSTQTINAGLPTGARFVLIKRTDSTGSWWVWDTARGMVAGTDPRLPLNSTAAEANNNWVYTVTNGFQIVTTDATVNASGGSYIYLAIA